MANLEVTYCGVKYKNPLILASASPTWDGEAMRRGAQAGCGGVVPKTIGPTDRWAQHPKNGRMYVPKYKDRPIGLINIELFTDKTREEWIDGELDIAKSGGAVMQVSIMAMPDAKDTGILAKQICETGKADLLEINASCPMPSESAGMHIGKDARLIYDQVRAAKENADIPVTVKLTPNVSDMVAIAKCAKEAGADGITISNTVKCFAGVDIETGIPHLRAFGGYSGAAIKPIVMRHLVEISREVDIPICAVGGVSSYRDIIEYVMLGATTVQICTEVMLNGLGVIKKILKDMNEWMDQKGFQSLDEIRGIALKHIKTVEELALEAPMHAQIDETTCKKCGQCKNSCFYRAIEEKDNMYVVNPQICDGCAMCTQICPFDSIHFVSSEGNK